MDSRYCSILSTYILGLLGALWKPLHHHVALFPKRQRLPLIIEVNLGFPACFKMVRAPQHGTATDSIRIPFLTTAISLIIWSVRNWWCYNCALLSAYTEWQFRETIFSKEYWFNSSILSSFSPQEEWKGKKEVPKSLCPVKYLWNINVSPPKCFRGYMLL